MAKKKPDLQSPQPKKVTPAPDENLPNERLLPEGETPTVPSVDVEPDRTVPPPDVKQPPAGGSKPPK